MDFSLLATKVHIPPTTGRMVDRTRLADALAARLPHSRLVVVAAPAGYGKTTLLAQWAHSSPIPTAWLSLSADENDLERFIRYFFSAWEVIQPDIRQSDLGLLLEGGMPELERVLAYLIHLAEERPGAAVFVLDDYHLIENPAIHQALTYLLDHFPPTAHIVVSTRADPPLPLARYRARAELLELRTEDLQFSLEESAAFFQQRMKLDLGHEEIQALHRQLEGWAAGLHLAGLTLSLPPDRQPVDRLPAGITGQHRFIADYLSQEVLDRLPDSLRQFLLQTSILDRLTGSLCAAVTGSLAAQTALETLERENLFLVPLDVRREWYRYHRLFADFLQAELSRRAPGHAADLHRRAAGWFLEQDMPEQAFHHALAGGDLELMVVVFDRYINAKLLAGELSLVKRWIGALPEEWYAAYPALGLGRAGYLAFTGAFEACLRSVDAVEDLLTPAESASTRQQLGRVKAVRCYIACIMNDITQAKAYAAQALQELPEDDMGFRPGIYVALGDTYRQNGLWEAARRSYVEALDFAPAPAMRVSAVHVYGALADLDLRQGHLHSAAGYWLKARAALDERKSWGRLPLPVSGWIYTRMAELQYEWNQLDVAAENLSHGLERAALGGDLRTQIAGNLLLSRMSLVGGDVDRAAEALEQARTLVERAHFPEWTARFERAQIELWLAEDKLSAAARWAEEMLESGILNDRPEGEITQLAIARVSLMTGDDAAARRALERLDHLLAAAPDGARSGWAIETLALQALAKQRLGDLAGSLTVLEHALRLAEPEGYMRLFVDLGLPMGRLLQEARRRGVMPGIVNTLLNGFGLEPAGPHLPEPLTGREQEILEMLAAGLTNREIAGQEVISPETVKKHVASIIGKLGASNRTQAVARARRLGLLG